MMVVFLLVSSCAAWGQNDPLNIDAQGNVGIGTAKPSARLEVSGRVKDQTGYLMPVGAILAYGGTNVPEGWLLCDGRELGNDAKFAELKAALGGRNNVPDLRSRFIVGAGQGGGLSKYDLNTTGGEEKHTLSVQELPSHTHPYDAAETKTANEGWVESGKNRSIKISDRGAETGRTDAIKNTGGGQAHENRPPYYALTYIIKY